MKWKENKMAFIKIGDNQQIVNVYTTEEDLKKEKTKKEKDFKDKEKDKE